MDSNLFIQEITNTLININCIKVIFLVFIASKSISSYKLIKDFKAKKIKSIDLSPDILESYESKKMNNLKYQFLIEKVTYFINTMKDHLTSTQMSLLNRNLSNLDVKLDSFKLYNIIKSEALRGKYNVELNMITIDKDYLEYCTIYHELMHLASSISDNNIIYSGFFQSSENKEIGRGINEGYTELLTKRYFKPENIKSYEYEIKIVELLETIVGISKMQQLYFTADLNGFIEELKKYTEEEKIIEFIKMVDFFTNNTKNKQNKILKRNYIKLAMKKINAFLYNCYYKFIYIDYKNGKITSKQFANKLKQFKSNLVYILDKGYDLYDIYPKKSVKLSKIK